MRSVERRGPGVCHSFVMGESQGCKKLLPTMKNKCPTPGANTASTVRNVAKKGTIYSSPTPEKPDVSLCRTSVPSVCPLSTPISGNNTPIFFYLNELQP